MKDQIQDAECSSRNKVSSASEHLMHLLRVGHKPNSMIIKQFKEKHKAELEREGEVPF